MRRCRRPCMPAGACLCDAEPLPHQPPPWIFPPMTSSSLQSPIIARPPRRLAPATRAPASTLFCVLCIAYRLVKGESAVRSSNLSLPMLTQSASGVTLMQINIIDMGTSLVYVLYVAGVGAKALGCLISRRPGDSGPQPPTAALVGECRRSLKPSPEEVALHLDGNTQSKAMVMTSYAEK